MAIVLPPETADPFGKRTVILEADASVSSLDAQIPMCSIDYYSI